MRDKLYPSRIGAAGSLNAYTMDGRFIPAYTHFILRDEDLLHFHIGAIEYKSPTGTTTGAAPRQYSGINKSIRILDNGPEANDKTFNDVVQGMVICDGPTPGTAVLLVTFGTGNPTAAQTGVFYRSLTTDTTPWTDASSAGATKLTAWQIIKAGPDLYAVCDAGRAAALGDYRISKIPAGNDPTLAASAGNGIEVGTPEWNITGLAAIGASPVVGKPDGLYYYDEQTRRYENVLKHYEIVPHALNGKVTQSVTGGVVYTTFDGGAYFFDGVAAQEISPHKLWKLLGKDIGNSRITAICDRGGYIDMVMDTAAQSTQNAGLVINKVTSAGAATAITTNCIDGSMATGGDVSSLAATSFIDVWADIPFVGIIFHVTRKANGTAAAVFGSLSYSSANNTFTAFAGFKDGTRLSANGSLSYVAFPPSASAGGMQPTNVNASDLIKKVDYDYASGTDVSQKYGMRVAMSGDAFDAATEIDEIEIIPARAGMPNGGIYSATTNFTPKDRAGMLTRVVSLKRERTTGFVPHDSYAVDSYGAVWAMAWHAGRLGQASGGQNLGQSLILYGRYRTIGISCGVTGAPASADYPITVQTSTTKPGPLWQIMHEWDGDDATLTKNINWVAIDTRYVQPTDQWEVFAQHDSQDIVSVARGYGGPIAFTVPEAGFRYMNMWLGVTRAATTNESAPQFLEPVTVDYSIVGDPADWPRDRADQIPSAV